MPYVTEDNVSVPNNGAHLYLKSLPALARRS